jgi:hypothetical protein
MMEGKYLTLTEQQLSSHFSDANRINEYIKNIRHLNDYKNNIKRLNKSLANNSNGLGKPLKVMKLPWHIENDEKFWLETCMMTIFYSKNKIDEFVSLFKAAFGNEPSIEGISNWQECFEEELYLFFEPNLPAPHLYKEWLSKNIDKRQFIPPLGSTNNKQDLDWSAKIDAILLNSKNGFTVIIESKVLLDISIEFKHNVIFNPLACKIDVMLDKNGILDSPLAKRDPGKSLFLLITPKTFKDNLTSRLYGYKFNEYKNNPSYLARDLPHRKNCNWQNISKRLGWLNWEDFKNVNGDCCPWLE